MKIVGLAFLLLFLGCGNPHIVEEDASNNDVVDGNKPVTPRPPNTPRPPDQREKVVLVFDARQAEDDDLSGLKIPYKTKIVKTIEYGDYKKTKSCPKKYRKKCVKNRQVLFSFDVEEARYLLEDGFSVASVELGGNFYSIGKNYRTELLCLLNTNRCSGRSIIKLPVLGLSFLVKMLWWEKKFWEAGHDTVVRNDGFHQFLLRGWNESEGLFLIENQFINLEEYLHLDPDRAANLLRSSSSVSFAITDDTNIENAKLKIELIR